MKNFKKIALLLLTMLFTVSVYGCSGARPTDVVNKYFDIVKKGDTNIKKLLDMIQEDEKGKEGNSSSNNFSEETQKKLLEKMKGITYKVNSETVNGDNAKVNVTVKGMDLNIVLGKVIQEAFSFTFSQSLSGNKMSDEENKAYFNNLFNKYLDEVTYSERTSDVELTKVNKDWKIKEGDTISKLLLGIDESTFNNDNSKTTETPTNISEMTLNTPIKVTTQNGDYKVTIEGARATEKRNEFSEKQVKQVVILDYNYENINLSKDLYIGDYSFQVLDDKGNVLDTYPVSDDNRIPKETPAGGKCEASATFGVNSDSKNLNITFKDGAQKLGKIIVPIK